jgi:hypothetical protein
MYGKFGTDLEFEDKEHLKSLIEGIYKCLHDPNSPINVVAALALSRILKYSP